MYKVITPFGTRQMAQSMYLVDKLNVTGNSLYLAFFTFLQFRLTTSHSRQKSDTETLDNQILLFLSTIIRFFLYESIRIPFPLILMRYVLRCLPEKRTRQLRIILVPKQAVKLVQSSVAVVYFVKTILALVILVFRYKASRYNDHTASTYLEFLCK